MSECAIPPLQDAPEHTEGVRALLLAQPASDLRPVRFTVPPLIAGTAEVPGLRDYVERFPKKHDPVAARAAVEELWEEANRQRGADGLAQ